MKFSTTVGNQDLPFSKPWNQLFKTLDLVPNFGLPNDVDDSSFELGFNVINQDSKYDVVL